MPYLSGDPAKYQADAADLIALLNKCHRLPRESLLERGLLDPRDIPSGPDPEIQIEDHRTDQRVPLPAVSWKM